MSPLKILALSATLALAACAPLPTWHWISVPTDQPHLAADSDDAIAVDDNVRIRNRHNGKTYRFKVTRLEKDGFVGVQKNGRSYKIRYADLAFLEVERVRWKIYGGGLPFVRL